MKNKILIVSFIIILIIVIIIMYINRTFILSQHNSIKQILDSDINNFNIYIETINPKETLELSENDKIAFIESLKGMKVKIANDIINGVSRNFIIENNKNGENIIVNITNSTISIDRNTYNILNGSINPFEEIYYKYTGKTYN